MAASKTLDSEAKKDFKKQDAWNLEILDEAIANEQLSSAELKSLIDSYFIFWNESIGFDVEEFWHQLQLKPLGFPRKDPILSTLQKRRFRNVHQAMDAQKGWKALKESPLLKARLSPAEMERFEEVLEADKNARIELLKKCLEKKKIPKSQYLRFGDSMAYIEHCNLIKPHFNKHEFEELHNIWSNFSF